MFKTLFIILLVTLFYTYFGYPIIMGILSCFFKKNNLKKDFEPYITIVIAAYNEERNIANKIELCKSLDYPANKLEIIVGSDGSTDKTDEIVENFAKDNVRLIRVVGRKGKTEVQNQAVKAANGEVIVFTDATTTYNTDVLRKIARNFSDPEVGCVGGELTYVDKNNSGVASGGGLYWKYEKKIKSFESAFSSLIGVSGCLYAVRKSLYEDIPADQISDFIIAQLIYKKRARTVYEAEAVSFEDLLDKNKDEFALRVRVALRSLHGLKYMSSILNPFKYGFYSLQVFSHKILRYAAPVFLILTLFLNCFLLKEGIFVVLFFVQMLFYCLAFAGKIFKSRNKMLYVPYYFCLVNFATLYAIFEFIKGKKQVIWETVR